MAGPSRRSNRAQFQLPPAFKETNLSPDVAAVYDDMRRFRAEIEHHRRIIMATVSELSSNVQRLIDVAMDLKNRPVTPNPTLPQDDAQLDELNNRIKSAIDVLTGAVGQSSEPTARPDPVDPNAPVANIP